MENTIEWDINIKIKINSFINKWAKTYESRANIKKIILFAENTL